MRNLLRNTQPVFYRLYQGQEEILDEYGNVTGSFVPIYGQLKCAMLSVSPNVGTAETNQFGTITSYDRTMVTSDTSLEIDEDDVLWVDGADTDGPWNYVIKARAPWKNSISFAIQKVTVSQYQDYQKKVKLKSDNDELRASHAVEVNNNADNQDDAELKLNTGSD